MGFSAAAAVGLTAAEVGTTAATVAGLAGDALIGAGLGAAESGITGGDPGIGALTGGLTGGLGGAGAAFGGELGIGSTLGGALGGAAGGAIGSGITGGNPLLAAATGGVTGALQGSNFSGGAPAPAGAGAPIAAGGGIGGAGIDPLASGVSDIPQNIGGTDLAGSAIAGIPQNVGTPSALGGGGTDFGASAANGIPGNVASIPIGGGAASPNMPNAAPSNVASIPVGGPSNTGNVGGGTNIPGVGGMNFTQPTGLNTLASGGGVPSLSSVPIGAGAGGGLGSAAGLASATPGGGDINELLAQVQSGYGSPTTQGSGGFFSNLGDKAGSYLSKNAGQLGLGALGIAGPPLLKAIAPNLVSPPMPYQGTLLANANALNNAAGPLISSESTGILPPGQQTIVNQGVQDAQTAIRAKYASMGLTGSTMEQQDLSAAQQRGQIAAAQMAAQATQTGLNEMGTANQIYADIANYQLTQDTALQSSISNLTGSLGIGMGLTDIASKIGQ